jgi:murein DD-endopeptidase MepM/ murein hydrolase activator NlpD
MSMSRSRPSSARRRRTASAALTAAAAAAVLAAIGCGTLDTLPDALRPPTPWERYRSSLADAGLDETALGRAWTAAGARALAEAAPVEPPLREVLFFDPAEPAAAGYRVALRRGQRLAVRVEPPPASPSRVFVDLLPPADGDAEQPRPVAHAEEDEESPEGAARAAVLRFEPGEDGEWLVRVQPELLAGGRHTVTVDVEPSLSFPVAGADARAIGGVFGDPRGGGRRRHEGVDIFAPRGTRALAAADAWVSRVGTNALGGNVVFLSTMSGLGLYYAHLDRQLVRTGQRVAAGEPVGLVGDTGNARGGPPHLHFGIYDGGALDPFPFLHDPGEPPAVTANLEPLGGWSRTVASRSRLRRGPGTGFEIVAELPAATAVRPLGASAEWYRVALPDGTPGFVAARLTAPAAEPLRRLLPEGERLLLRRPVPGAPALARIAGGEWLGVLAEYGGAVLVETAAGRRGWLGAAPAATLPAAGG